MIERRLFTIANQEAEFLRCATEKEFCFLLDASGWTIADFHAACGGGFESVGNRWFHLGRFQHDYFGDGGRYVVFRPPNDHVNGELQ